MRLCSPDSDSVACAVWKNPIPPVMTTSGGHRITGASGRKTGGCDRKSMFPPLFFLVQWCAHVDESTCVFPTHVSLRFLLVVVR